MAGPVDRWSNGHIPEELLSAYLAGDLDDEVLHQEVEAHLERCPTCREVAAELDALVHLLQTLPEPQLPRSFALTPEMVSPPVVTPMPWVVRLQPALRWATAAAALLLVLVLGADLIVHRSTGTSETVEIMMTADGVESGATEPSIATDSATNAGAAEPAESAAGSATDSVSPTPAGALSRPESAQAPPAEDATRASGEAFGEGEADASAAPMIAAPSDVEHETAAAPSRSWPSIWRLTEVSLALLVIWLLVATFVLPRVRAWRN